MSADLIQRLRADADGLMSFPHPSECDRLHSAFAVMQSASTELERLTAELAAARVDAERFHWLREWLVRNGQLLCVECQPTAGAKVGPYWVFRRAYMVDGTSLEGYGKTEDAAIDAARQAG